MEQLDFLSDIIPKWEWKKMFRGKQQLKMELEKLSEEHALISKYHEKYWFQKLMRQTEAQLLNRYYMLATHIEQLERDIQFIERKFYKSMLAEEALSKLNDPLNHIDLKRFTLVQSQLF